MTLSGHIENGQVVLHTAPALPDGTQVTVTIIPTTPESDDTRDGETPTLYERMKPIIGIADHLPPDASTKIDQILYGRDDS